MYPLIAWDLVQAYIENSSGLSTENKRDVRYL